MHLSMIALNKQQIAIMQMWSSEIRWKMTHTMNYSLLLKCQKISLENPITLFQF